MKFLIPILQQLHRWILWRDMYLLITLNWACDYLPTLGLNLTHVSKRDPNSQTVNLHITRNHALTAGKYLSRDLHEQVIP